MAPFHGLAGRVEHDCTEPVGDHIFLLRVMASVQESGGAVRKAARAAWPTGVAGDHRADLGISAQAEHLRVQLQPDVADAAPIHQGFKARRTECERWGLR